MSDTIEVTVDGQGPPLFLISGMFAGSWAWYRCVGELKKHYTVIRTVPALCEESGNIKELHKRVVNTIKSMDLPPVTLSGASLGGTLSIMTAASHPELVNGIVICSSPGEGKINLELPLQTTVDMTWANLVKEKLIYKQSSIVHEDFMKVYRLFESRMTMINIIRLSKASAQSKIDYLLSQVVCPVGAIWGSHDLVTPLEHWRKLEAKYRFRMDVIENTGHVPMYEEPERFTELMKAFCCEMSVAEEALDLWVV